MKARGPTRSIIIYKQIENYCGADGLLSISLYRACDNTKIVVKMKNSLLKIHVLFEELKAVVYHNMIT